MQYQDYKQPPFIVYAADTRFISQAVTGLFEAISQGVGSSDIAKQVLGPCKQRYYQNIVIHLCNKAFNHHLSPAVSRLLGLDDGGCPLEEFLVYYTLTLESEGWTVDLRQIREDWLPFLDDLPNSADVRETMVLPIEEDQQFMVRKGARPFYRLQPRDADSVFAEVYLDYRIVCWEIEHGS